MGSNFSTKESQPWHREDGSNVVETAGAVGGAALKLDFDEGEARSPPAQLLLDCGSGSGDEEGSPAVRKATRWAALRSLRLCPHKPAAPNADAEAEAEAEAVTATIMVATSKLVRILSSEDVAVHVFQFLSDKERCLVLCATSKALSATEGHFRYQLALLRAFAAKEAKLYKHSLISNARRGGGFGALGDFAATARALGSLPSSFELTEPEPEGEAEPEAGWEEEQGQGQEQGEGREEGQAQQQKQQPQQKKQQQQKQRRAPRSPRPCDAQCGVCGSALAVAALASDADATTRAGLVNAFAGSATAWDWWAKQQQQQQQQQERQDDGDDERPAPPPALLRLECRGACRYSLVVHADRCELCAAFTARKCDCCDAVTRRCTAHARICQSCSAVLCDADAHEDDDEGAIFCGGCSFHCQGCDCLFDLENGCFSCEGSGCADQEPLCGGCWDGTTCAACERQQCADCGDYSTCNDCGAQTCSSCFGDEACPDCNGPVCPQCESHF